MLLCARKGGNKYKKNHTISYKLILYLAVHPFLLFAYMRVRRKEVVKQEAMGRLMNKQFQTKAPAQLASPA